MSYIYPTFSRKTADDVFDQLQQQVLIGRRPKPFPTGRHHPQASLAALGGNRIVPVDELMALHQEMKTALASRTIRGKMERGRHFDTTVGPILVNHFRKNGLSQAANPNTWSYLTLVAFPDLAIERFPPTASGLSRNRFTAGRRNIFHSRYLRSMTLGDLLLDPDLPIFENELVGLFDRQLSNDHDLARKISNKIASIPTSDHRRKIVRDGLKEINYELRVTDLSRLEIDELDQVLIRAFS